MEVEIWRPLSQFRNLYEVSNLGRVRSVERVYVRSNGVRVTYKSVVLKQQLGTTGYWIVPIFQKPKSVHRLIAQEFIKKVPGKEYVNHINSIRSDNTLSNLEWCTQSENIKHGFKYGFMKPTSKAGLESNSYKHGETCRGTRNKTCVVCDKSFTPRIVRIVTCC
jgi:hypothetical protein